MNQDQVKEKLLLLTDNDIEDFQIIFSGKKSKKVNGLYYPDKKEIIIHNRNFENDDNSLIYTAIHEFAHHVHNTTTPLPISSRAHTNEFWSIFHKLLDKACELDIYKNIFETNDEFNKLTKEIKKSYLFKNAELMREVGKLLVRAINLCQIHKVRFEDYIDRGLMLNRATANTLVKIYTMDINPEIGFDNMKIAAKIKDEEKRKTIEDEMMSGKTPEIIKAELAREKKPVNSLEILEKERQKIQRTIERLNEKLDKITERINGLG